MSLKSGAELGQGLIDDPMVEFREGIELLKNEYPEKALVRFKRALDGDSKNPFYLSFLGLSIARAPDFGENGRLSR